MLGVDQADIAFLVGFPHCTHGQRLSAESPRGLKKNYPSLIPSELVMLPPLVGLRNFHKRMFI